MESKELYFEKKISRTLAEVRERVELKFKEAGFGILSEIKLHEKFSEKLNVNTEPYIILGVCSPKFAYEAYKVEDYIGILLPCKVVLKQEKEGVRILVLRPEAIMSLIGDRGLNEMAEKVSSSFSKVLSEI